MLKKQERLTKQEFDRSFSLGKRIHTPLFQIIYHPSPTFHGAVVVGKKVFKRAVARNRLRRRLYGALYRYHKKHGLAGTIIVVAKPALSNLTQKEISPALNEVLAEIKV